MTAFQEQGAVLRVQSAVLAELRLCHERGEENEELTELMLMLDKRSNILHARAERAGAYAGAHAAMAEFRASNPQLGGKA